MGTVAGAELTVSVLTFGPGDHPFFKFGHNAVWIHDEARGRDAVFNFGMFAFDSPLLIFDFLQGRLRYWLAVHSLRATLDEYRSENRTVEVQELNLTPAQRLELARALAVNAREENKYYKYDYYRDNCSTRVRDAIDRVLGGRLRAASTGPASMSWRDHTRRLTADNLPVYFGLHAAMGDVIDAPVTAWDEMFLPSKVQEQLRRVTVPGAAGDEPLVRAERLLVRAEREPPRDVPPRWELPMLAAGLGLGGLAALAAARAPRRRLAAQLAAVLYGLYGLFFGLLGTIFVGLWAFTDHEVAFRNENILQFAPWTLGLAVLAAGLARGRARALRWARCLVAAAAGASLLGLALKASPAFDQDNAELIALLLPLWMGSLAGLVLWERRLAIRGTSSQSHEAAHGEARRAASLRGA